MMSKAMMKGKGHDKGAHIRPEPEDLTQTSEVNADGSVLVTTSFTGRDGEEQSRSFTIADNDSGGVVINTANTDDSRSKSVTFSEDADDGGIDIDISCLTEEGETKSRHIELDMNDDGTIAMAVTFTREGEEITHSHDIEVAKLLGEEGEELTMAEVVESYLERHHIDDSSIDLTGINNLTSDADSMFI